VPAMKKIVVHFGISGPAERGNLQARAARAVRFWVEDFFPTRAGTKAERNMERRTG